MTHSFDRQALFEAFDLLNAELQRRNVRATLFVVGGAAMAIAYDSRRSTTDVDAIFVPADIVRSAAQAVGQQMGIEEDWLNDGVRGFAPGHDEQSASVYEREHLSVAVASPKYLLAMKLLASRSDRDIDDIRTLYKLCAFSTVQDGIDVLSSFYPAHLVPARVQFMLQEMFPERDDAGRDRGISR